MICLLMQSLIMSYHQVRRSEENNSILSLLKSLSKSSSSPQEIFSVCVWISKGSMRCLSEMETNSHGFSGLWTNCNLDISVVYPLMPLLKLWLERSGNEPLKILPLPDPRRFHDARSPGPIFPSYHISFRSSDSEMLFHLRC